MSFILDRYHQAELYRMGIGHDPAPDMARMAEIDRTDQSRLESDRRRRIKRRNQTKK